LSADYTFPNGASISGAGDTQIQAGAVITANGAVSVANLSTSNNTGNTLAGSGTLTVTGTLAWQSGSMTGSGTTKIAVGGLLDFSSNAFLFTAVPVLSRTLEVAGAVTDSGSAGLK